MHLAQRLSVLLTAGAVSGAWAQALPLASGSALVLGRYTTQSAEPPDEASEPLAVVAKISFPRAQVRTVGDAVQHTLLRTGWTLADSGMIREAGDFLNLPLPESQREVGPYRVSAILEVLVGRTWQWQRDPVRRRLWITVAPAYAALVQAPARLAAPAPEQAPAAAASTPELDAAQASAAAAAQTRPVAARRTYFEREFP